MKKKTANLYIDGYNFYYAITKAADAADNKKESGDNRIYRGHAWCNFKKLGEQLLQPDEQLGKVVYCTANVGNLGSEGEKEKQKLWLSYLKEYIPNIKIKHGHHVPDRRSDNKSKRKEKMTDVNMAVEIVIDGLYHENMDIAILITEDIDYFPAVIEVCEKKKIEVQMQFPPKESGHSKSWDKKKEEYNLDRLTVHKLTLEMLASSVLPYRKKDNKEACSMEKFLPNSIRKDIYKDEDNRYWTYDAIKESVSEVRKISVDDIVCNVTADEKETLEKSNSPGWKRFKENGISVYDYLEGTYKT